MVVIIECIEKKIYDQTKTAHTFHRKKNKYTKQVQIESLTRNIKKAQQNDSIVSLVICYVFRWNTIDSMSHLAFFAIFFT